MSTVIKFIITAVAAYLLGSLNFSIIISKLTLKKDIRDYGSGNAGSTNSLRVMGMKKTVFVLIGDALKGVVAVLLAVPIMYGEAPELIQTAKIVASVLSVLGHAFPVYFGFRGGKGVLTTAFSAMVIDWRVSLIAIAIFVIIVAITKFVSLGSIIAVCTAPIQFALFYGLKDGFAVADIKYIVYGLILASVVTYLHRGNIKRLVTGTENKLSFKKK